ASCSDAARTHAPNATDRTPGMCSESTVSPFGNTVRRSAGSDTSGSAVPRADAARLLTRRSLAARTLPAAAATAARTATAIATTLLSFPARPITAAISAVGLGLRHPLGSRRERLHGKTKASTLIAVNQLDLHAIALLDHVLGLLGALVAHLRDVHQAFGAGHDLDERADRRRRLDEPLVGLADHRFGGDRLNHLPRTFHRLAADGRDRDDAIVVDGELGARLVLDAANGLALRSDEVADLLGADLHRDDTRRKGRQLVAALRQRLVHLAEDVHAAFFRLRQRFLENVQIESLDLDVHLDRGDAVARAGDLEVHVAEVILGAKDVGEDRVLLP